MNCFIKTILSANRVSADNDHQCNTYLTTQMQINNISIKRTWYSWKWTFISKYWTNWGRLSRWAYNFCLDSIYHNSWEKGELFPDLLPRGSQKETFWYPLKMEANIVEFFVHALSISERNLLLSLKKIGVTNCDQ